MNELKIGDKVRKVGGDVRFAGVVTFIGELPFGLGERVLVWQAEGWDKNGEQVSGGALHVYTPKQLEKI